MQRILITGGAGYIGSHAAVVMLEAGHEIIVLDNLCNSSQESLRRVELITGHRPQFVYGDIRDAEMLKRIFAAQKIDSVMHFAGLKAVSESLSCPLEYYDNNVGGTVTLCRVMAESGVHCLVFSSSATVYGVPPSVPIREDFPVGEPANPYGRSKLMVEKVLTDLAESDPRWSVALLRYFNPVGAHPSALLGEDPDGIPNNLVPFISQVAVGRLPKLSIFGNDYPTRDGTGVRDYIHVLDLAKGHLAALMAMSGKSGVFTWNLGTGRGYTVLETLRAFEKAAGKAVPYEIVHRRPGDIAECWADPEKAQRDLDWKADYGLEEMMQDVWRWQSMNPYGYHAKRVASQAKRVNRSLTVPESA